MSIPFLPGYTIQSVPDIDEATQLPNVCYKSATNIMLSSVPFIAAILISAMN